MEGKLIAEKTEGGAYNEVLLYFVVKLILLVSFQIENIVKHIACFHKHLLTDADNGWKQVFSLQSPILPSLKDYQKI